MASTGTITHGTDFVYYEDYGSDPTIGAGRVASYMKGAECNTAA